jgi:hypothetical protein
LSHISLTSQLTDEFALFASLLVIFFFLYAITLFQLGETLLAVCFQLCCMASNLAKRSASRSGEAGRSCFIGRLSSL